jgi:mycothiol synthase
VTNDAAIPLPAMPAGLATRPATRRDIDAITALVAACERSIDGVSEIDPSDIDLAFELAPSDDGVLVVEDASRIVAWATTTDGRADADVHPDHLGRGIGAALLHWTEERVMVSGRTSVRQVVTDANVAARRLFEGHGYTTYQTAWVLEKTLDEAPPTVEVPSGILVRPFDLADAPAVFQVIEDAFSEWPGREPSTFEKWAIRIRDHVAFAPDLSRVAFDGEELVGAALCMDYDGQDDGWVQQLATKATHRHRGIARALLEAMFLANHETGKRKVGLSTNSRTGALGLYERLEMRVRRSYTGWAKDLGGEAGS